MKEILTMELDFNDAPADAFIQEATELLATDTIGTMYSFPTREGSHEPFESDVRRMPGIFLWKPHKFSSNVLMVNLNELAKGYNRKDMYAGLYESLRNVLHQREPDFPRPYIGGK